MKTLRDIEVGDILYIVIRKEPGIQVGNFTNQRTFIKYDILERPVLNIRHTVEPAIKNEDLVFDRYWLTFTDDKDKEITICIDLSIADCYLYHYGTLYINREDAELYINNYFHEAIKQLQKETTELTVAMNELNQYYIKQALINTAKNVVDSKR